MKITYTGPSADIDLPSGVVARGDSVDVSDEVGASLIESGDWSEAKPPKNTKAEEATS